MTSQPSMTDNKDIEQGAGRQQEWVKPRLSHFEAADAALNPQPSHDGQEGFSYTS